MGDGRTFAARLSEVELRQLTGRGRVVEYRSGDVLMRQGDEGDRVIVLRSGLVKVLSHDQVGGVRLLGIRRPGELLGEMACLDDRPRSATVLAGSPLTAVTIARSRFLEYLDDYPRVTLEVCRQMSDRLRAGEDQQVTLSTDRTDLRVLKALLAMCALYAGDTVPHAVTVPLSQTEIGQLAGVSLVSAQRSLRRLRDRSLVTTRYGRLVVPCVACLRAALTNSPEPVTRRSSCPRCHAE
jgi:CRP-like cAMP-binding protein